MKIGLSLVAAAALMSGVAQADNALAMKSGCLACHAMETMLVGPAIKDIAAKYKGDDGAASALAAKVKAGGVGVWGQVPMPPSTAAEADIATIVDWMLNQ